MGLVLAAAWLVRPGGQSWPEIAAYLLAGAWLVPALTAPLAARRCERRVEAAAWYALGLGMLLTAAAHGIEAVRVSEAGGARPAELPLIEMLQTAAFPLWLLAALPLSGMAWRFRADPSRLLDVVTIAAAALFIQWWLIDGALLDQIGPGFWLALSEAAEPVVFLVAVLLLSAAIAAGQYPERGRALLGFGAVGLGNGGLVALYYESAAPGGAHELLLVGGAVLVAAAAVERLRWDEWPEPRRDLPEALQLAVPLLCTLPVAALGTIFFLRDDVTSAHLTLAIVAVLSTNLRLVGRSLEARRRFEEAAWATWHARQAAREQEALAEAAAAVTSSLDVSEIFGTVVDELSRLLHARHTALIEVDQEGRGTVRVAPELHEYEGRALPADRGMVSTVLRSQGTVVLDGASWRAIQPEWLDTEDFADVRVVIGTPMHWDGRVRGVLIAARSDSDRFEPSEIRVAEAFAEFAGVAIGHAELLAAARERHELSERRIREQRALIEASKSIKSNLDFQTVARRITSSAAELMGAERFACSVVRDGGQAEVVIAVGYDWVQTGDRVPVDAGIAGRVVDSGKTVLCDREQWLRMLQASGQEPRQLVGHAIGLPVRWQDRVRGAIELGFAEDAAPLGVDEIRVLETFAELLGLALGNVETLAAERSRRAQSERRLREEEALILAAKTIATSLERSEVMARIAEQMRELIGADSAGLNMVEEDGAVRIMIPVGGNEVLAGHYLPEGQGLSGLVLEQDRTVVVNDHRWDLEPRAGTTQRELRGMRAAIAAPVRLKGEIRAVLLAGYEGEGERIEVDQIRLVEAFAELAALALDNAETLTRARKAAAESQALREAAAELAAQHDSQQILDRLVEQACSLLGADAAGIGYIDEDLCTRMAHATGMSTDAWRHMVIPPAKGLAARTIKTGEPLIINGLGEDPDHPPENYPLLAVERLRWVLAVPMAYRKDRPSILTVGFRRPHRFTREEIELVQGLANQGAIAMDAARLIEEREASNAELRIRLRATIDALASTLEARDGYTGDHSLGVSLLVEGVARRMGMDEEQVTELRAAARLHDIGKLGIPNEILRKEGPLETEEWEVMHEHPVIGERIVAGVPGLETVARTVRHEHEHVDGSGYPDGLAGEAIPLASRIILACDAFHAMTTDRPYRKAMGSRQALMELARCAGSQFDPAVVEALFAELEWEGTSAFESPGTPAPR